jgi:diadenosine tetraphosphatase ApaH/serine/threonine PP2A family protein phosphatase
VGNHDHAALNLIPLSRFNYDAQTAVSWTINALSEDNREYLQSLPSIVTNNSFTLAHGSPREPIWEYILDAHTAEINFSAFKTDYCLIGHSHLPLTYHKPSSGEYTQPLTCPEDGPLTLKPRMLLNPGSVGQPRDLDPRAAYAVLDLEKKAWSCRRVPYDITDVQLRILQAGLPERQATRLVAGW